MSLIIHAVNIHQGGGRTLLLSLISAINRPAILLIDERLTDLPPISSDIQIVRIGKSLLSRLKAEFKLRALSMPDDVVLCLGNLPPLLKSPASIFVYLQNRYLCTSYPLDGFDWKVRLRIIGERLWLRYFLRDATVIVQTETMKQAVYAQLKSHALVLPFRQIINNQSLIDQNLKVFDFIYVASGEPHKNHRQLLNAWIKLAQEGIRPSLCLTLNEETDIQLLKWINNCKTNFDLNITNLQVPIDKVDSLYLQSKALIYPSLFESFGLPLLEANNFTLPIIASERDYVYDVVIPNITFDPDSALSISRAVKRHLHLENQNPPPETPESFLSKLIALN